FFSPHSSPVGSCNRRSLLRHGLLLAGAYAASPWLSAGESGVQDEVWNDASRSRLVPVLVRWPDVAVKPQGVVIFSHGTGGKRSGADVWGSAWTKAGLVVVHLQHMGSDAAAVKSLTGFFKASAPEQLVARVDDVKFAMDEIQRRHHAGQDRWGDVPVQQLALAGHSFGARTVLAMAGQSFPKAGGWSGLDKRIKAFIALSPALGRGATAATAQEDTKAITRPMLLVSGSMDGEVLNNGETVASRRLVYDVLPSGAKALLWLENADHMTFAGVEKQIPSNFLVRRDSGTLNAEGLHHRTVAAVTTAWLKEALLAQPMASPAGLGSKDLWLRG
ncbi:MAG: hypothetical protein WB821_05440, partial [Burkholderiaceae bacterium]